MPGQRIRQGLERHCIGDESFPVQLTGCEQLVRRAHVAGREVEGAVERDLVVVQTLGVEPRPGADGAPSEQHHRATAPDQRRRTLPHLDAPRAFHDHVGPSACGPLAHGSDGRLRSAFEYIEAQRSRVGGPERIAGHDQDALHTPGAQHQRVQQRDGARPEEDNGVLRTQAQAGKSVNDAGQRLEQRPFDKGKCRRLRVGIDPLHRLRKQDVLPEAPEDVALADGVAEVFLTPPADVATPARGGGHRQDGVAFAETPHPPAHRSDLPAELVSQGRRRWEYGMPALDGLDVGTAGKSRPDAEHQLTGPRFGIGQLTQFEPAGLDENIGFHAATGRAAHPKAARSLAASEGVPALSSCTRMKGRALAKPEGMGSPRHRRQSGNPGTSGGPSRPAVQRAGDTGGLRTIRPQPVVSVVLPFRDAETTLGTALHSLRRQTLRDFECLLIDHGSRDASSQIAAQVADSDRRFRVLRAGGEFADALNAGLAEARAPLVARMDADDIAHPRRLEMQVLAMCREPDLAVVSCRVRCFPRHRLAGGTVRYERWLNGLLSPEQILHALFIESPIPHPSTLLRRDVVMRLGAYRRFDGPEDYDLWMRILLSGHRARKLPATLLAWRESPRRLSRTDARYGRTRFERLKLHYLPWVIPRGEPVQIWGAGPIGKRWGRMLRRSGWNIEAWIDVNPRKIGSRIHGIPVLGPDRVQREHGRVLLAVGLPGAREQIEALLQARGFLPWRDYVAIA